MEQSSLCPIFQIGPTADGARMTDIANAKQNGKQVSGKVKRKRLLIRKETRLPHVCI